MINFVLKLQYNYHQSLLFRLVYFVKEENPVQYQYILLHLAI